MFGYTIVSPQRVQTSFPFNKLSLLPYVYICFNAIVSQLWFRPFWVMFLNLWLKVVHIDQRQNMNWPLAANFETTNVTFLPKKLASNVQSSCIDNSKRPKSELWHYCIKATNYYTDTNFQSLELLCANKSST